MCTEVVRAAGWRGLQACRQRLLGLPQHAGQQLLGQCHSPAAWQLGSVGAPVVHGGVWGGAGTATLLSASAAVGSGDRRCQINRERPRCQTSAVALRRDAGCGRGGEPWGRAQVCFEAIRRAETWVRAGEVGLLVEQGWVWSISEHLTRSRSRICPWEGGVPGARPSLVPTGCVRGGETVPLL